MLVPVVVVLWLLPVRGRHSGSVDLAQVLHWMALLAQLSNFIWAQGWHEELTP